DYEPTIFYPKRSPDPLFRDFTTQCERMDIPFLSYLPAEVGTSPGPPAGFPAGFGASTGNNKVPGPRHDVIPRCVIPRCVIPRSLSVSPGWTAGPGGAGDISPAVLVSLAAPKEVARRFQGRRHFLAGRFVPEELRRKFGISPAEYPGSDCVVAL
ncbi:YJEN3 protein, partial [Cinclus mexicanus]|nr:YJEN3 protein [Cinclus mexicanus]